MESQNHMLFKGKWCQYQQSRIILTDTCPICGICQLNKFSISSRNGPIVTFIPHWSHVTSHREGEVWIISAHVHLNHPLWPSAHTRIIRVVILQTHYGSVRVSNSDPCLKQILREISGPTNTIKMCYLGCFATCLNIFLSFIYFRFT